MTRHLDKLTIHRFRGLRDLVLSDFGDVNLFVGINNSGKTTVLEALSTYCRPLDPLEWLATASRREIEVPKAAMLDALKWLFPQTHDPSKSLYKGETLLSGSGAYCVLESEATFSELLSPDHSVEDDGFLYPPDDSFRLGADLDLRATFRVQQPSLFEPEPTKESTKSYRLWQDKRFTTHEKPPEPRLPVATISPISHWKEQTQLERLTEATLRGTKEEILNLLMLFDPAIRDLEILSRRGLLPALHIQYEGVGLAPISALGDGVRRALLLALTIPTVKDGLLLIDEVGSSTHKSVMADIFRWLVKACSENKVQLFATTHSLDAIDAMLDSTATDRDTLVAFRLAGPSLPVKRFGEDLLHRIRYESGLDVR